MNKETITLVLSKDTTQEEIKNLRKEYNNKRYRVNLIVSGEKDYKENIKELVKAGVN